VQDNGQVRERASSSLLKGERVALAVDVFHNLAREEIANTEEKGEHACFHPTPAQQTSTMNSLWFLVPPVHALLVYDGSAAHWPWLF
jgi:hypothetical protein